MWTPHSGKIKSHHPTLIIIAIDCVLENTSYAIEGHRVFYGTVLDPPRQYIKPCNCFKLDGQL